MNNFFPPFAQLERRIRIQVNDFPSKTELEFRCPPTWMILFGNLFVGGCQNQPGLPPSCRYMATSLFVSDDLVAERWRDVAWGPVTKAEIFQNDP
jgi:hypothetical protein